MSIAIKHPGEALILKIMLLLILGLLAAGLISPIITLKKFYVIENTFSVYSGVIQLLREDHIFLFILITGFSIVLPVLKIAVLFFLLSVKQRHSGHFEKFLYWMHVFGKWSMLDVFVVAILVVSVKLGAIASVEMQYGLYIFATAVVLTMLVTARVVALSNDKR